MSSFAVPGPPGPNHAANGGALQGRQVVLGIVERRCGDLARITVTSDEEDLLYVRASPGNDSASPITIAFVEECLPRGIVLQVGREGYLSLDTDLHQGRWKNALGFLDAAVAAVVAGRFTETIWWRGGLCTGVDISLTLDGEPFCFRRRNIPNWVRSLGGETRLETITYATYAAQPSSGR